MAIENAKDVDFAAGIVLNEVIPLMSKRSMNDATPPRDEGPEISANVEGVFTCSNVCIYFDIFLACI